MAIPGVIDWLERFIPWLAPRLGRLSSHVDVQAGAVGAAPAASSKLSLPERPLPPFKPDP